MPLLTMPLEMFERIAEHLDEYDILELRLVSRDTASMIERTFAKTHFRRPILLLTENDLSHFIKLARQPRIITAMETLVIRIEEIHHVCSKRGQKPRSLHNEAYQQQQEMRKEGRDLKLLTDIFVELKQHTKLKKIELREGKAYVYNEHQMQLRAPDKHDLHQLNLVLQALQKSGLQVERFLTFFGKDYGLRVGKLHDESFLPTWPHIFAGLESLRLTLQWDRGEGTEQHELAGVLAALPELLRLTLGCRGSRPIAADNFMTNLLDQDFANLECLCLTRFIVKYDELKRFLDRHGSIFKLKKFSSHDLWIISVAYELLEDGDEESEEYKKRLTSALASRTGVSIMMKGNPEFFSL